MKKILIYILMVLASAVICTGCGNHNDNRLEIEIGGMVSRQIQNNNSSFSFSLQPENIENTEEFEQFIESQVQKLIEHGNPEMIKGFLSELDRNGYDSETVKLMVEDYVKGMENYEEQRKTASIFKNIPFYGTDVDSMVEDYSNKVIREITEEINTKLAAGITTFSFEFDPSLIKEDPIVPFMEEQTMKLFQTGDPQILQGFLTALHETKYDAKNIKQLVEKLVSETKDPETKIEYQRMLQYVPYFGSDIKVDLSDYLLTHEAVPVHYKPGEGGYYDSENHQPKAHREYTNQYGAYRDYSYSFYGDFMEVKFSGYKPVSSTDLTSVPDKGRKIYFQDHELYSTYSVPKNCIWCPPYLYIVDDDTFYVIEDD